MTVSELTNNLEEIKSVLEFCKTQSKQQLITISHNPSLLDILKKTFGYKQKYYILKKNNEIIGIMPLVKIGKKSVSLPHFSYGGPIFSNSSLSLKLFPLKQFEIRSFECYSNFFSAEKTTVFINLANSSEELFSNFKSKLRSQIKKGYTYSIDIKFGQLELLDDFYLIYSKNMLHLGSPPLPKIFFKNILNLYKHGDARITIIEYEKKPVAAGFTLSFIGFEEVCWASSDYNFNKFNFNMVLYWEMIKKSIEKENNYFSFGRSTIDSNTYKFKMQWGNPRSKTLYYNYDRKNKANIKKIKLLSKIWKYVPYNLTLLSSKYISKYIY
jgi:lipid II:glycine glycyltransferase (peptidoglycan interpeptide bridge formation enzyme)